MKKLMIAMGAAALCGAVFADVTSANIVGYTTQTTSDPSISMGATFVGVGNNTKWKLSQLVPNGIAEGDDYIQFLDTANASVSLLATWYDPAEYGDEGGWCNALDDTELLNDLELTPGTAFLSNFSSKNTINYQFSGEVIKAGSDNKVTIDVSGQGSPFICNPLPKTIKLGDVTPAGFAEGDDFIQFLDSKNASVFQIATWYDPAEFGDEGGWCDALDDTILLNDRDLVAGEAFLGNIGDGTTSLKFVFPSAL